MKKFFDKFSDLKGAKFIGIRRYTNQKGEVADLSVLVNFDYENAVKRDLKTLNELSEKDLNKIVQTIEHNKGKDNNIILETLKLALSELINSFEKNLTENNKTTQSVAQSDAYFHLTKGVKLHKETMNVFVYGLLNHKTIHVHGEYPARKKSIKTICKEAIKEYCQLRSDKYRQYNIGNMNELNISGTSIVMK